MQRDEIGLGEQARQVGVFHAELLLLRGRQPVAIAIDHAHAEGARHAGRERADFTHADDAKRFVEQADDIGDAGPVVGNIVIRTDAVPIPAVLAHGVVSLKQPFPERHHKQNRVLGGELECGARHAGDENAAQPRSRQFDRVRPRPEPLDELELRVGIHECSIDRAAAEDQDAGIAALAQIELRRHRNQ